MLKLKVKRLEEAGVLKRVNHSKWAVPTLIIPKKDSSVRFISDFRELNKQIKRKPIPITKIQDMPLKLEGFKYCTTQFFCLFFLEYQSKSHMVLIPHAS